MCVCVMEGQVEARETRTQEAHSLGEAQRGTAHHTPHQLLLLWLACKRKEQYVLDNQFVCKTHTWIDAPMKLCRPADGLTRTA